MGGVSRRRVVVAAVIGNALEWYDFILYALFAPAIAVTFFPARTEVGSLLLAAGTFGAGFVMRPVGALVLGQYADRCGRRAALSLIIALMTAATALMVFTPGWRSIGLIAPALIVVSRLLQGFSVGGELGSSTALLIEVAPAGRRGFFASWQGASQLMASLAAAGAGALVTSVFSPAEVAAGWWRLPFSLGLLIGPVGWYIRRVLHEPAPAHRDGTPLALLWARHRGAVLRSVGLIAMTTTATYVLELGMPTYAHRALGLPLRDALVANFVSGLAGIVAGPWAGALSDRFGARRVMLPAVVALALLALPAFMLLTAVPTLAMLIAVQTVCLALRSTMTGPVYGLIGSLFPAEVRSSGLAIAYNTSVLLFGGFAPFITTWLIAVTGNRLMPGVYVTAGGMLTLGALTIAWPRGQRLPADGQGVAGGV